MDDSLESVLKKEIALYSHWMKAFRISINRFNIFETTNVLFLEHTNDEVMAIQRFLIEILRKRLKISKSSTRFLNRPHITIAKTENKDQFNKSWDYFKQLNYTNEFKVHSITVLKRKCTLNNYAKWSKAFEVSLNTA